MSCTSTNSYNRRR
uniref:Uncharacterized protein n=1 Tax=Arundo donax TaxID=35708 RepID=A0A0A8ZN51_ARUDO